MSGGEGMPVIGPFSRRQANRIEKVLRSLTASTGVSFAVYLGDLAEPVRHGVELRHAELPEPVRSVLIAVSPNQRIVEIVTGSKVRRRITDRDCLLAARSMTAAFDGGDLTGGVIAGAVQLAGHAGPRPFWF